MQHVYDASKVPERACPTCLLLHKAQHSSAPDWLFQTQVTCTCRLIQAANCKCSVGHQLLALASQQLFKAGHQLLLA
jgi:hypothetical protein